MEILALLSTKLSSSKIYKVGMLFFILWALIYCKFQHEMLPESLLNVHSFDLTQLTTFANNSWVSCDVINFSGGQL